MAKEACTKLGVGAVIDRAGVSHSRLQQSVKPPVVYDKEFREHSRLLLSGWSIGPLQQWIQPCIILDLVLELPAVSLGRMFCLVYLLACLIFPTLCENHASLGMPPSAARTVWDLSDCHGTDDCILPRNSL